MNLKIYVLDYWLLAVFFFLFFQLLWELKGFVICDLWIVGIKGFCVFFFFAVNLVAMNFFCCELGCCD